MAYIGGKSRAHWLYQFLNHPRFDDLDYIEPFVGMANVLRNIKNKRSYTASDYEPMIVNLLQNIQKDNFHYPFITKDEYLKLKEDPSIDYDKACFAAYTYSYLGKRMDSYFDRDFDSLIRGYKKLRLSFSFMDAKITCNCYKDYSDIRNTLIYCDPPYYNANYYNETFCHDEFWDWVRKMSKDNFVFISEYQAPHDMMNIFQKQQTVNFMHNKGQGRIEKLFVCNEELIELFQKQAIFYNKYQFPEQIPLFQ